MAKAKKTAEKLFITKSEKFENLKQTLASAAWEAHELNYVINFLDDSDEAKRDEVDSSVLRNILSDRLHVLLEGIDRLDEFTPVETAVVSQLETVKAA
jgi:hypothetical protein